MVLGYTMNGSSFAAQGAHQRPKLRLAPDGTRIEALIAEPATDENKRSLHVTFLLNFFDELRRKAPLNAK